MGFKTEWIQYGPGGKYRGYLAKPDRIKDQSASIVVIQEIWGVDDHIQDVTRRFAQAGYVALSPDLYAKDGKRIEALSDSRMNAVIEFRNKNAQAMFDADKRKQALSQLPAVEAQQISETLTLMFGGLDRNGFLESTAAAASFLRNENAETKGCPVGSVGYCLGGALSAQLACIDPLLKGAVIYYGAAPSDEELDNIQCPVVGFYGGRDHRITDSVPAFAETMRRKGKSFVPHIYNDAEHAFFNDQRPSYHLQASRDAFAKTLHFFNQVLGG